MTELEKKIKEYADAYYRGEEIISDAEYDALLKQLKKENPNSEFLKKDILGDDLKGISKKYKLEITMGTLSKCNTEDEMQEWWNKHPHNNIVAESKIDGCLDYDTIICTDKGDLKIGDVVTNKINCRIKSFDFDKNKVVFKQILNFFINKNDSEWFEIELENGQKIKITGNHKVYLPDLGCWRDVKNLDGTENIVWSD